MAHKVIEIIHALLSEEWTKRTWAQRQLVSLTTADEWRALVKSLSKATPGVLTVVVRELGSVFSTGASEELVEIFGLTLTQGSPFRNNEINCREIIETFLSSDHVDYQYKVEALLERLKIEAATVPCEKLVLVPVLRGLVLLQAKGAVTYFEELLANDDITIVFEAVRAVRILGDPNSGVHLEKLFGVPNWELASAAISAYAELGGNSLLRSVRLYRIYFPSDEIVRKSILSALIKIRTPITFFLLLRIYAIERDRDLRLQILKTLAIFPNRFTAKFILRVAALESDSNLRVTARTCFETFQPEKILSVLKQGLRSKNPRIKKRAILKCGQLPANRAFILLEPYLRGSLSLSPALRLAMVDTVGKLPEAAWATRWLIRRLSAEGRLRSRAISALLKKKSPPVLEILDAVQKEGLESLESFLAILATKTVFASSKEFSDRLVPLLYHEAPRIRYLAARVLLSLQVKSCFEVVWMQTLCEDGEQRNLLASLLRSALGSGKVDWDWIPMNWSQHDFTGELRSVFLRSILSQLNTALWDLDFWQKLVASAVSGFSLSGRGAIRSPNLPSEETGGDILLEFLQTHDHFLNEIRDPLLEMENSLEVLRVLVSTVSPLHPVKERTLALLFRKLEKGGPRECELIIECLAQSRNSHFLPGFIDWHVSLEPGILKEKAYRAMAFWLNEASPISGPVSCSTARAANG